VYRKVVNVGRRVGEGADGRFQVAAGGLRLCSAMFGQFGLGPALDAPEYQYRGHPQSGQVPARVGPVPLWYPQAPDFGPETSPRRICSYFAIIQLTAVGAYRSWGSRAFGEASRRRLVAARNSGLTTRARFHARLPQGVSQIPACNIDDATPK